MFQLFILAFLIHGVFSTTPCTDGEKIISQEIKNPEDIVGNWTYVYHWDPKAKFNKEFVDQKDHAFECPQLHFEEMPPGFIEVKKAQCATFKTPFNWADAKLKVDSKALKIKDGVIIIGEKENWMAVDCATMVRVVIKKVSENYIAMANPDEEGETELIARERPTLDELKCVSHNLDVGKGMSGFGVCYK